MKLRKSLYACFVLDFFYIIGAASALILKVNYLYGAIIPFYFMINVINYQMLRTQSIGWLKTVQWLRIVLLLIYGVLFMTGVIMITTYHYGSWVRIDLNKISYSNNLDNSFLNVGKSATAS